MSVTVSLNVNDEVWVKLTDEGHKYYRDAWNERLGGCNLEYYPPREDSQGYSQWQLWCLMDWFGPGIHMGMAPFFHGDILLTDPS